MTTIEPTKGEGEYGVKFNEPITGEIVRALRFCYESEEIECYECPCRVSGGAYLCHMDKLADRLESQERAIASLTARAESAERERDAAKAYMKRFGCLTCEGQGTVGLNEPCWGCRDKSNWKMRGLPQDGEGKK